MFSEETEIETQVPFTTNILIHIRNNMLKSLWNSKFGDPFHQPIDDQVYTECYVTIYQLICSIYYSQALIRWDPARQGNAWQLAPCGDVWHHHNEMRWISWKHSHWVKHHAARATEYAAEVKKWLTSATDAASCWNWCECSQLIQCVWLLLCGMVPYATTSDMNVALWLNSLLTTISRLVNPKAAFIAWMQVNTFSYRFGMMATGCCVGELAQWECYIHL